MTYRVWFHDEFVGFGSDEERDDRAWAVPDTMSLLYPERPGIPCNDVEEAAEQYADYFHSNRDGWENTWPVDFVVHDGERFHLVSVDREYEPMFSAATPTEMEVPSGKEEA